MFLCFTSINYEHNNIPCKYIICRIHYSILNYYPIESTQNILDNIKDKLTNILIFITFKFNIV